MQIKRPICGKGRQTWTNGKCKIIYNIYSRFNNYCIVHGPIKINKSAFMKPVQKVNKKCVPHQYGG